MAAGENRFNRITSKEWLPFQKSWFLYDEANWIRGNFRFFSLREPSNIPIFYFGSDGSRAASEASELDFSFTADFDSATPIQYAFVDLRNEAAALKAEAWPEFCEMWIARIEKLSSRLIHRRFLTVAIANRTIEGQYYPFAWELAGRLGRFLSLKDEKIACLQIENQTEKPVLGDEFFYCLQFRKDELSGKHCTKANRFSSGIAYPNLETNQLPKWFILRPQRRKQKEILHPAKFPEDLPELFISRFTEAGENVFDPMSGTGSTQLAAIAQGRNGYGIELSSFFADIARERTLAYLFENASAQGQSPDTDIIAGDARKMNQYGFPLQHLVFTSPPYWDMLNMKGAENQAKRLEKGLKTNYSDDTADLGNLGDYESFVGELADIYRQAADLMVPGGLLVIVVKNIKKKGSNYPFAWDLAAILQQWFNLLPEVFWCQDDISIAPYGYGNTFVSNTFHQYCLVFQKP